MSRSGGFVEQLRRLRTAAGLTQEQLAEKAKLSTRAVSDLERGVNRTARRQTAALLADALGLPPAGREAFLTAAAGRGPEVAGKPPAGVVPAPATPLIGREADVARAQLRGGVDRRRRAVDGAGRGARARRPRRRARSLKRAGGNGSAAGREDDRWLGRRRIRPT